VNPTILRAQDLVKHYPVKTTGSARHRQVVKAVDGVSLAVKPGEVFGLVGESGCGKSTLGRLLLYIEKPTAGRVFFEDDDLGTFDRRLLKRFRREAQIIYQDPYSALNPRQPVGSIIEEPLVIHAIGTAAERRKRVAELLQVVGLRPDQAARHRPGPGPQSTPDLSRRTGFGPGRFHPGPGHQPAGGTQGPVRPDLHFHFP
jgi:ABC-type glutathione transport system ATPase component